MSTPADVRQTDPARLSGILTLNGPECPWQPDELQAVLRHQLASPLDAALGDSIGRKLAAIDSADSQPLPVSLAELLHHPHPPLALLETLKDFSKSHALEAQSPLPREIAMLLYYSAIIVALTRCGSRITGLSDAELRHGIEGMLDCHWIDGDARRLLEQGRDFLQPGAAGAA
jgi:hypothetical protein